MTRATTRATTTAAASAVRAWTRYPEYRVSGVEWIGRLPAHWELKPLKYVVFMNPDVLTENTDPEYELAYLDIGNIDSTGNIADPELLLFADAPSRARKRVADGDTLLSTVRTYLKAIAFIERPIENLIASTGFAVLRPTESVWPRFLYYLTQSDHFIQAVVAHSEGVSYPAINSSTLGRLPVWLPDQPEQRAIAGFLDGETARIDALITKKERLVDLLQEKRTALITNAVTKGLDPDVPMKDSGVAWLGEVPAHWQAGRIRNAASSVQTGPFGSQLHADDYVQDAKPVVNPTQLQNGRILPDWNATVDDVTANRLSRHLLKQGDIVIARRGEMGRAAIVTTIEVGWLCGTGSARIRPTPNTSPAFLNWYLATRVARDWLSVESVGTTMENLNRSILSRLPLAIPPSHEQASIAAFLDIETGKIDTLVSRVREHVQRLQEFRTALISAAVTGQIDVGEHTT